MKYHLAIKKEQNTNTCYAMEEAKKHYAKWKKPGTKDYVCSMIRFRWNVQKNVEK